MKAPVGVLGCKAKSMAKAAAVAIAIPPSGRLLRRLAGKTDPGTARELLENGRSLLPGGVVRYRAGDLRAGDCYSAEGLLQGSDALGPVEVTVKEALMTDSTGSYFRGTLDRVHPSSRGLVSEGGVKLFHACNSRKKYCEGDADIHLDGLRMIDVEVPPRRGRKEVSFREPEETPRSSSRRWEADEEADEVTKAGLSKLAQRLGFDESSFGLDEKEGTKRPSALRSGTSSGVAGKVQETRERRGREEERPLSPVQKRYTEKEQDIEGLLHSDWGSRSAGSPRSKRSRSRERDRRRRRRSSSSESSSESDSLAAPGETRLQRTHRKHPGRLFRRVSKAVSSFLERSATMMEDNGDEKEVTYPKFERYYRLVLSRRLENTRNRREAQVLTSVMDLLLRRQNVSALDMLAQRLLALEAADLQKSWAVAQHIELLAPESSTALTSSSLKEAGKAEVSALKLKQTLERARQG